MTRKITREEFKKMMDSGRKFCWATLYERQDFLVNFGQEFKAVREITHEPNHWHRQIGKR